MDALTLLAIILVIIILFIFAKGVVIVQPYQKGLAVRLGTYTGQVNPGFKWVVPFITTVYKLDLRTQVIDVPSQEVITKDNSPTDVDAIIYVRVMDPERAYFEVANYRQATVALAQTSLRGIIGDMELDEVLYNRDMINRRLRDILDKETDQWGVKIERVEIKEVNPIGAVKQAMTEQTSAERERRAAILRADGEKRAAILKAEGLRQSMILESEGERQSKILRAEGTRQSRILEAQGEAQGLRKYSIPDHLTWFPDARQTFYYGPFLKHHAEDGRGSGNEDHLPVRADQPGQTGCKVPWRRRAC